NAAKVCKAVKRETTTFIEKSEKELKKELERYEAPPEAVEAKLQVKRNVDIKLNRPQRRTISEIL
ncbi:prostatic steroid-binding protein C1-like, partial [Sigmodon hispidus]